MKKYSFFLFLAFISYFSSISLMYANQNPDSKASKRELKTILNDANKLNVKKFSNALKSIFKEGLKVKIDAYISETIEKEKDFENKGEFYTYLEDTISPQLAIKIYYSLLRDELKKSDLDHKIISKAYKTKEQLNENEQKNLDKTKKTVVNFLFNGTIILLSILDKEEYQYIRIFLEELQLLANINLPDSFLKQIFKRSIKDAHIIYDVLKNSPEAFQGYFESIHGDQNLKEGEIKIISFAKLQQIIKSGTKAVQAFAKPIKCKTKVTAVLVAEIGLHVFVLNYFTGNNPSCNLCPSNINSIQNFCNQYC